MEMVLDTNLQPCGFCRRCAIHDDPGGCLTVSEYVRQQTKISTKRFTWFADEDLFVAEASDVAAFAGPDAGRRDPDLRDGFTLVSHVTGHGVEFVASKWERDREGDLLWIDYEPIGTGQPLKCRVRIFND